MLTNPIEEKIRILIVEDEALIAENLKLTLEDLGYQVAGTYYHFDEAWQAMQQNTYDLILLDINLGSTNAEENGIRLASLIQKTRDVPFIFLTAHQDKDTILQASQLKPSAYLIKPVTPAAVFAAVQIALDQSVQRPVVPPIAEPDFFFIKLGQQNYKLQWQQVYCMEASKNYVLVKMIGSRVAYPIRGTLSLVTTQLLPASLQSWFVRANRSTVLNWRYISSFSPTKIVCHQMSFENTRLSVSQLEALMKGVRP